MSAVHAIAGAVTFFFLQSVACARPPQPTVSSLLFRVREARIHIVFAAQSTATSAVSPSLNYLVEMQSWYLRHMLQTSYSSPEQLQLLSNAAQEVKKQKCGSSSDCPSSADCSGGVCVCQSPYVESYGQVTAILLPHLSLLLISITY
jgi:hypothetical protein